MGRNLRRDCRGVYNPIVNVALTLGIFAASYATFYWVFGKLEDYAMGYRPRRH